jgi:RNA polymerase sigma factor (sigma-70 family)
MQGHMTPSNEELIQACRHGDAVAWEALIARYQRLVYSIPRRAGFDEDRSAEIFQRVFEKLVEYLDRIEQPARIGAWLTMTARREMWHLSQSESAVQPLTDRDDSDDETYQLPDSAPLPDEVLLHLEEQHTIRMAVAALDERCRHLLTLLFYRPDPPPYAEVATTLKMSEGSIGPTRIRCLQKLRRQLDGLGYFVMYFLVSTALLLSTMSQ